MDDEVDSSVPGGPSLGIQSKKTKEIMFGLYRMIDNKSSISLDITYGRPEGYLSDPYKQIGITRNSLSGRPCKRKGCILFMPKSRPGKRQTFTTYLEAKRYFEDPDGTLETSYRLFADDSDLLGHTFEIKWIQRIGDSFAIHTYEFYTQTEADFYRLTLDGSGISPAVQPGKSDPYYSADYELSKFNASTHGIKLIYFSKI